MQQPIKNFYPLNQNFQASVKDVWPPVGSGTLLQLAVTENLPDLVRLLLEFGFVSILETSSFYSWHLTFQGGPFCYHLHQRGESSRDCSR